MKDLAPRILGGVTYAGLLFMGAYFGGIIQWTVYVLLAGVLSEELCGLLGLRKLLTIVTVLAVFVVSKEFVHVEQYSVHLCILLIVWQILSFYGLMSPKEKMVLEPVSGIFYIGLPMSLFLLSAKNFDGAFYDPFVIVYLFVVVAGSDVFAYFVGKWKGKTPLWKSVSPNKTREGGLGGLLITLALLPVFLMIMKQPILPIHFLITVLIIIAGVFGDLFESRLKRIHNVKDSGTIIPGHGGLLDRMDSILFAMPWYVLMMTCFKLI